MNSAFLVKYQPKTFSEMVGIDKYSTVIKSIVENELSRPIMFIGENGTGKSTIADIMLKRIVCDNPNALDPCNECDECKTNSIISTGFGGFSLSGGNVSSQDIDDVFQSLIFVPIYNFHVLVLDDLDEFGESNQKKIRDLINSYPLTLIFSTVTKISNILKPLLHRHLRLSLNNYSMNDLHKLVMRILNNENMKYEDDEAIYALINLAKFNPRSIVTGLEYTKLSNEVLSQNFLKSPEVRINLGEHIGNN